MDKIIWHKIIIEAGKNNDPIGSFIIPGLMDDETIERLHEKWKALFRPKALGKRNPLEDEDVMGHEVYTVDE